MSINHLDDDIIDKLYEKHGFLDNEGFLIGTNHPNFKAAQKKTEDLSKKLVLTKDEEREAAELIIIEKAYTREFNKYIMDSMLKQSIESESDDGDFDPNNEHEESASDDLSYDSIDSSESRED